MDVSKTIQGLVTKTMQADVGQQISSSSGNHSMTSESYADVTNLTVTITTTGRPVVICCIPDGSSGTGGAGSYLNAGDTNASFKIVRDSTDTAFFTVNGTNQRQSPAHIFHLDVVTAGTYTYKIQTKVFGSVGSYYSQAKYCKLLAYEL